MTPHILEFVDGPKAGDIHTCPRDRTEQGGIPRRSMVVSVFRLDEDTETFDWPRTLYLREWANHRRQGKPWRMSWVPDFWLT